MLSVAQCIDFQIEHCRCRLGNHSEAQYLGNQGEYFTH
jgi:hypothetical protein